MFEDDDDRTYHVVINDEEQFSIWPTDREVPAGWRATGTSGAKADCLAHIDEVWSDMRPRSLRLAMAGETSDE
jgi:MbtH protein